MFPRIWKELTWPQFIKRLGAYLIVTLMLLYAGKYLLVLALSAIGLFIFLWALTQVSEDIRNW